MGVWLMVPQPCAPHSRPLLPAPRRWVPAAGAGLARAVSRSPAPGSAVGLAGGCCIALRAKCVRIRVFSLHGCSGSSLRPAEDERLPGNDKPMLSPLF